MKKTVLVTGASRGIGKKTALALAGEGSTFDRVVMVGRPSEHFREAVDAVQSSHSACEICAIEADLSDPNSVVDIYDELEIAGIRLNVIVNNAGFTKPASITDATLADFELTMRVNLFSPFAMVKLALLHKHPLQRVVNIASTAGITGRSGWLTYSASKAAVINMSEVMRDELQEKEISVICLSPGRTATDLRRTLAPDEDPNTIMQPEQVATIVRLMTSETGMMLNSQNIVVRT
jgi:3-oxoacyl-[acyl-carrier protein] reductase